MNDDLAERPFPANLYVERALRAHVTSVNFVGAGVAATLGSGQVCFVAPDGLDVMVPAHAGAILCACSTSGSDALLTGGDDGKACLVTPSGVEVLEQQGKWVDAVAARDGALAYAFGKIVTIRIDDDVRRVAVPSAIGGIALTKSGFAIAHLGGVTMASLTDGEAAGILQRDGYHVAITVSPNGRFVVTATLDHSLCCWRVADGAPVEMAGYIAKPISLSWTKRGAFLATSGYRRVVMWPMLGKGPRDKHATTFAPRNSVVTAVACHPTIDLVAVGYADGCVLFGRQAIGTILPVRPADGQEVTCMAFDRKGGLLAFGTAGGVLGLLDMREVLS